MVTRPRWEQGARVLRGGIHRAKLAFDPISPGQSVSRRLRDAHAYWSDTSNSHWSSDSHWRDGIQEDLWLAVGQEHLAMFEMFAKALDRPSTPGVIVEWGCGGGANAVAFAPIAKKFIAADVSEPSLDECSRQIKSVSTTPIECILVDIKHPELAITGLEECCDTFICVYVLELTAGRQEALRILRIAERLLARGGMAVIQVKYHTTDRRTRGHTRNYRSNAANMTTFGIDEFWLSATECGLTPRLITLVPQNQLDSRYAYYALTKP